MQSSQVRVGDLGPGNEAQSQPQASREQLLSSKTACSPHSKGSLQWEQRKHKKARQPATPLSTLLSAALSWSQTTACQPPGAPGWFHSAEGALQIENNSLPVKGNVLKHRKRNTTVGGG